MQPTEIADRALGVDKVPIRLRVDVIDALMAAKGARSKAEQARRFGMDRANYFCIRTGRKTPTLAAAMRMAAVAGTSVEALFGREP